jgi:hypothetical protein
MIDYSGMPFPKGQPKALLRLKKRKAIERLDEIENIKARARAAGRCEVIVDGVRCPKRDAQTHHLKGGIGRRNRGDSVLAIQKLRTCHDCHPLITGKILQPTTAVHDALTVRYRRVR